MKVLVVEDEPVMALNLQQTLEEMGHEVCEIADTAEEAVFAAAVHQPDLVFMDYRLHGPATGADAARAIHARLHPQIIFCTAQADRQALEDMRAAHPAAMLPKPYTDRDLRIALDTVALKDVTPPAGGATH